MVEGMKVRASCFARGLRDLRLPVAGESKLNEEPATVGPNPGASKELDTISTSSSSSSSKRLDIGTNR